jgi:hypothetical protein
VGLLSVVFGAAAGVAPVSPEVEVEHPSTVKGAEAVRASLAVFEKVPHCVGTTVMVSTKGVVSVYTSGAHLTVPALWVQLAG